MSDKPNEILADVKKIIDGVYTPGKPLTPIVVITPDGMVVIPKGTKL